MKQLHIIIFMLFGLMLVAPAHATNDRNLAVNQVNNPASEKRIALVIGNSAYTNSPLKNPVNDAKDVAAKLRKLGFDVVERHNLTTKQIGRTLSEFRSKLVPGSVALVFYAGHGIQIKGENFLPAVDADIEAEEDVANQSLAVKQVMDVLDESKTRLNLVFLDACRNNPYARSFRSAGGDGLARITAPSGTLISYATRPGSVAQDGEGHNGLYTSKLLAQMDSNLQIEQALKQVVTAVKKASLGKQEPWMEGSIEGDFCFAGCAVGSVTPIASIEPAPSHPTVAVLQPNAQPTDPEYDLWTEVQKGNSADDYQAYLEQYPKGKYAVLAKTRLKKLKEQPNANNSPKQTVNIEPVMVPIPGKNYEMGKYDVTQGEWKAVMGNNPSHFIECGDNCPVENVSWDDIQIFLTKLNVKTGKQYRLPTEAEWEYACYGGTNTSLCGGKDPDTVAWYAANSNKQTHPVGQKQANGYGLYDMSGNVSQWLIDCYNVTCKQRKLRGGSWYNGTISVLASMPDRSEPAFRAMNFGFRLARTLP